MYADLLEKEGINSQYLVVLKPRRYAEQGFWTVVTGTIYSQSFLYGQVIKFQSDDTVLTQASSSSVGSDEWYYDEDTSNLFVDIGSDPNLSDVIVTYELYIGTIDAHFNRDPLDETSRVVYFEPLIISSPQIQASNSDILFGFLPSTSTNLTVSNLTQFLQKHLYDSSFNRCEISVYHWLDTLITENVKLVTTGICGSITSTDETVDISIFDNNEIFNVEFRYPDKDSFFALSRFPNLDPNYQGRPIRKVYGYVDGFVPININYFPSPANSNTNNRQWVCTRPASAYNLLGASVLSVPAPTTTRSYLSSINGWQVGDGIWFDSAGTDQWATVTAVNRTTVPYYLDHTAIGSPAAFGDVLRRSPVSIVYIYKNGVQYTAYYQKHYDTLSQPLNDILLFQFYTTLEADLGFATPLDPDQDLVYARVYGTGNDVELLGSPFGSDDATTATLSQGVVIFYDLLTNFLGIPESQIDTDKFTALQSSVPDRLGFSIPQDARNDFPTYKDLFTRIAQTLLLKMYISDENTFAVDQTAPMGVSDKTIQDDEILDTTFRYNFDYRDIISDVFVQYNARSVSVRNQNDDIYYKLVSSSNNVAKRLHQINKQQTFTSLHFDESEAQALADRLAFALGERRGLISFITKNRFFDSDINQAISVSREKIPGYEFDSGTEFTRKAAIISIEKSLDKITITLDDQKGIEDNYLDW